ncbi:hypothetical protein [Gibbsiella quercinecans]|uniref:Uncharacterized protein n=1 Tax=Gibbsiella quercinecans TaxID=929813 RepID=A0A250B5F7_9GAMM|nr:hypothetical protein [Gibbsiella quercinecans]ATA21473.1 hypothetical protein AWC35_20180 [Gibbsiella quercinecans]RLM07930.1 hypothetical protein BIY30_14100 [Gibbsiella quercinecans]RLM09642.1 hypothetical protein BIY31_08330 [Gibbsiella quercinecans]
MPQKTAGARGVAGFSDNNKMICKAFVFYPAWLGRKMRHTAAMHHQRAQKQCISVQLKLINIK